MPASGENRLGVGRYFEFSTDQAAARDLREFWRDTALNRSDADFPTEAVTLGFSAMVRGYVGVGSELREGRSDALILRRSAARCRQDSGDEIMLSAIVSSDAVARYQNSTTAFIVPIGRFLVNDMSGPFDIEMGRYRSINFRLSRNAVARAIGNYPTGLGGRLLPETPLTSLLFTQLVQIADALPIMDDAAREVALTAATDFALATLRHVTRTEAWDDDAHLAGLWLAAERLIERHLGCTDLNPDFLAHALHCSRTHLYRVFAQHGTAVMDHIREIRLHRSRDMLADPSCQLQVAEIASLCGMDNPSAFSRSFRLRFGCAPADIRRQARLGIVGD